MALFFGESNTTRHLLSREAVTWASVGARPFTHFLIVDTTDSASVQYWWSTGNYRSADSCTIYMTSNQLWVAGGTDSGEPRLTVSPNHSGGLRLLAMRSGGGKGDNNSYDYQGVFSILTANGVDPTVKTTTISASDSIAGNSLSASPLMIGDRVSMVGQRSAKGYLYMAGSFNRYIEDSEFINILSGRIRILDHLKHDIVELWDFQKDDESSVIGLVGGTSLEMRGEDWGWGSRYPDLRIYPSILTNKSKYTPVPIRWWAEEEIPTYIIKCPPVDIDITSQQSSIPERRALSTNVVDTLLTPYNAGMQIRDFILAFPVDVGITTFPCYVSGEDVIPAGVVDIPLSSTKSDVVLNGMYVVNTNTQDIDVSPYNTHIKEISVVNTSHTSVDITTSNVSVLGESVVDCISGGVSPTPYNSGITLEGMYVVDVDIGDIDVSSTNASTTLSGEYILRCTSNDIDLSTEDVYISQNSNISTNVADIDITPYQCSVKQEGVDVINVSTNVIDISTYSASVKANTNIDVDTGSLDISPTKCTILEFPKEVVDCREADIDISPTHSDVHLQGEYIVRCTPSVVDINTANADVSTYNDIVPDEIDIDTYSANVIEFPYAIINCNSVDVDIEAYKSIVSRGSKHISIYHEDIILYEGNLVVILRE